MKTIVLGDTHGRTDWKRIVDQPCDKIIFIGDYVDTHENITGLQQVENLREIIDFKQRNSDKVILLVGNHDYQYWPGVENEWYSGFQSAMKASFRYEFETYQDLFQMCYVENDIIFSHAGFTEEFVEKRIGSFSEKNVNDIFKYKPLTFAFYHGDRSGCGDHPFQSCIWVRPQSLMRDHLSGYKQVVGHTTQKNIIPRDYNEEKDKFWFIDTLPTSGEYLVIEDGEFEIQQPIDL